MSMWTAVVSFAVVAGLLTIVPGVDTAIVLRAAVTRGTRVAWASALGVSTGLVVWGVAAACGLSVLLTTSHVAYTVLRIAGALYLIWLGATSLIALWRGGGAASLDDDRAPGDGLLRAWLRGALSNLLNPKVGVFYIAMLPQFIPATAPHLPMGLGLAALHLAEGQLWFAALIFGVRYAKSWFARPAVKRAMEAVTGSVLVAFGLKLALSDAA
ncbi:LysE family translocator [Nocardia sp. NPDC052566]|uniref:LysE family translocator n=1 Tax=Nocardia sp. NPDC052566 TaxID=3364330 RepID=UPI0037C57BE6